MNKHNHNSIDDIMLHIDKARYGLRLYMDNDLIRTMIIKTYVREVEYLKLNDRTPHIVWLDKYLSEVEQYKKYKGKLSESKEYDPKKDGEQAGP